MSNRLILLILLANFILLTLAPVCISTDDSNWWDDDWSFRQELFIPINTSGEQAKFQPIDTRIRFGNPCWAKNEKKHSVRVVFQENENLKEIESQIYDLNYSDDSHIEACSLVFLIPEDANGNERYYVYYDEHEKSGPNYPDRVEVEASYYNYEPIPGLPFESHYYKITEDESVIYAVAQGGKFMGGGVAQQVTKLKPGATDVMPKSGELFASFDFMYFYGAGVEDYSGSIDNLISKEILVDGNLMVKFGIVSESIKKDVKSTVTYKYYYCPTEHKRISAHVKHEILKEFTVAIEPEVEGTYASFQCGGLESNSIKDLNFGRIYPYLHVYTEQDKIAEYALNPDPEVSAGPGTWASTLFINTEDDLDLGEKAWISFDEGETGIAHSLIIGSNNVMKSGTGERDGIQIKGREQDSSDLPGLESNMIFISFSRNSYEMGSSHDLDVPDDLVVEYDAEFFSTNTGGYRAVEEEADLFQSLVKIRPLHIGKVPGGEEEETCSLTVFVHMAPSVPMGSALSILTGKNLSYISAELYHNENIMSTGIAGRISTNPLPSFDDTTLIQKIKLALGIFDWKNLTFFKKIRFQNLEPGRYLVKIYKENSAIGKDRKYIGFTTVDVQEDTKTRVFCKPEGSLQVSIADQNGDAIKDAKVLLSKNNVSVSESVTDDQGRSLIKVPCSILGKYDLKVLYNGFAIYEEPIRLGFIRKIVSIKRSIDIERHDFTLEVLDTWGLSPEINFDPVFVSNEMIESTEIHAEKLQTNNYLFSNLIPANYQLRLQYKSFLVEENVQIPTEKETRLVFLAEFNIKIYTFDFRGIPLKDAKIVITREGKKTEKNCDEEGFVQFSLPPGNYRAEIYLKDNLIGERKINVIGERTFDLVTTEEPVFPLYVIYSSVIFLLAGAFLTLRKKNIKSFLKILAISLVIASIVMPWWMLHGSSSQVETSTKMYLSPPELITTTTAPSVIAGELASLPEIFTDAMTLASISIVIGCILIILNIIFERFNKRRLSFLSISSGALALIGSIFIFSYAMSELVKVGVGDFFGEGNVDISLAGEGVRTSVFCNWGPSIGFYLCLLAAGIVLALTIFSIKKMFKERTRKTGKLLNKDTIIKYTKRLMPLIGIFLLIYLIVDIGTDEIASTFLKISPFLIIISASLTLPRMLIRNYVWQIILKKQKINVSFITSLKIFLIGYFYGSITPGYVGQLMRIPYLKEKTNEPTGKLFVNLIVEEGIHTLSLYLMMIIGAFLIINKVPEIFLITCVFLVIILGAYGFFIKKERGEKTFHLLIKLLIPKKFKPYLTRFVDSFYKDFPSIKSLIYPFIIVIPSWIIIYSQIYILGLSLDIEVPYFEFLMLYSIANVVAFIPITSAGLGTREATLIFLFSFYGVSPEKALVLSLAGHLITDALTGFYGFIVSVVEARNNKKNMTLLEIEDTLKKET